MLNAVKMIMAVLFVLGGAALAAYKYYLGGGIEVTDWLSAGLLSLGGAGYILYPLAAKLKNMKLPKLFKSKTDAKVEESRSHLSDNRQAIDHLMEIGVANDNKVIIDAMIALNSEVFVMEFQGKKK